MKILYEDEIMKSSSFTFTDQDGIEIFVYKWEPDSEPKAVVQIVHGVAEHAGRYINVVNKLVPEGYIIYGDDHRGHGRSGGLRGYVKSVDEFVQDQREFTKVIREKEGKELPLFIIGHSMGSLISILYMADYPEEFKGVVLSGTGSKVGGGVSRVTILMAKILSKPCYA